jgi:hypothetical protein
MVVLEGTYCGTHVRQINSPAASHATGGAAHEYFRSFTQWHSSRCKHAQLSAQCKAQLLMKMKQSYLASAGSVPCTTNQCLVSLCLLAKQCCSAAQPWTGSRQLCVHIQSSESITNHSQMQQQQHNAPLHVREGCRSLGQATFANSVPYLCSSRSACPGTHFLIYQKDEYSLLLIKHFVQMKPDCRPDLKGLCEHDKPSKTALAARIGCEYLVRIPNQWIQ